MSKDIALITCGPAEHGISRFGRDLAAAAVELGFTGTVLHQDDPHRLTDLVGLLPPGIRLVHLQANDWLFTDAVRRADDAVTAFAAALRERGTGLSLTLHDLPHPGVPRELFLRRARVYAAMIEQSVAIVVSSGHERSLIHEAAHAVAEVDGSHRHEPRMTSVTVIPLPIPDRAGHLDSPHPSTPDGAATVGVLGYLYPGKGHREVLDELGGIDPPVVLVSIGRPSPGHEWLLPELTDAGRALGVGFICTGFVPDAALMAHLRDVDVPVAPSPQISASASINSWLAAGRRPLVADSRYARELSERMPEAVDLYRPGELGARVRAALVDPWLTRLPPEFHTWPDRREVATRYVEWLHAAAASLRHDSHAGPAGP